jgi:[ribosomal protein S5]-alanine N-acetyltransferase
MLELNFLPFPILETERLILRRIDNNDVNEILELRGNPQTMKFIPRPLAKTTNDAIAHITMIDEKIINNEGINWGITLKGDPKLLGIIGHYRIQKENFRAEIGYMLNPKFHGKGIITEAIREVVNYGFDNMNLHSIEGVIDPENFASEKVLQKNGFTKEAHFLENEFAEGKFWNTVIYSLLKKNRLK